MAAGERIEIDLDGQGRWVQVEPALVDTLIENRHAIEVNAGQILLSSRAVNELAQGVIHQSGTLTANSMVQSGGRICSRAMTLAVWRLVRPTARWAAVMS